MYKTLYEYVVSTKVRSYQIFLAPTWRHYKDLRRLESVTKSFYKNGVIPNDPDIFLLPNAPLSASELEDFEFRIRRVGPAALPQLQDAIAALKPTAHAARGRSGRSQSNHNLYTGWEIACLRHWMIADYQHNQFEYMLLQSLTSQKLGGESA